MRLGSSVFAVIAVSLAAAAWGQSKNLAPGFTSLPKGASVVIMPTDIELFSISGGGVLEPKADWTEAATQHFKTALRDKKQKLGLRALELADKDAHELAEGDTPHAAGARAIAPHHFGVPLPPKEGKLDLSPGHAVP